MNIICSIKKDLLEIIKNLFSLNDDQIKSIETTLNVGREKEFGDLSCNAALVLAKELKKNPREIAATLQQKVTHKYFKDIQIAGPGFLNIFLTDQAFKDIASELFHKKDKYFHLNDDEKKLKYLIEFVSANPTGPLHLGHGRGGIIGDVLANVLNFVGHKVSREFYINDAGNQIKKLGDSFKVRCEQQLGLDKALPEKGYAGEYLIELAKECVKEYNEDLLKKDDAFFTNHAKEKMLANIKKDLKDYGIEFDNWFSEKSLHDSGAVDDAIKLLQEKDLVYEDDGALWFRSTNFGDDKDRVVKKKDGELTYIAADIAYHKNKFERGFDKLIDILGQDHHGYVMRLKATVEALGFNAQDLDVILYQLVSIKINEEAVKMSKRAGVFTTLREVIDTVGKDVARFFYLNRKAEAHLEFDLNVALKKTDENPVYYIQYAYVRTRGILEKAAQEGLEISDEEILKQVQDDKKKISEDVLKYWGTAEFEVIKKIISLQDIINCMTNGYQTHMLAYYLYELAHSFHNYYSHNRIVDPKNTEVSNGRLYIIVLVRHFLGTCLDLLGISKPEKM